MTRLRSVRDGLERVWSTQGREFVTFEAEGNEDLWIQYLDGELNVRWPLTDALDSGLDRLGVSRPPGTLLLSVSPGSNAVLGVGALELDDVASLIDELFTKLLGTGGAIVARVESHR